MRKLLLVSLFMLSGLVRADYVDPGAEITQQRYARQKVVYELNSTDINKQKSIFKNIVNHKEATDGLDLVVLVHGEAVRLFYSEDFRPLIDKANSLGVTFKVCNNSIRDRNLDYTRMHGVTKANLVRAGLPELVVLQAQGYSYLVP